ncbi:hypothetical protein FKG94_09425 [Exilibacterium tricleocarpae]|uniref:Uncharacterized protein n=1 Tax=Exilibacterium tricleocarpae TaxID=2591008 RepID=A0A545TVS0_9GAMM|nr:hypothetical protein [Exilibacterium tricleocarpae]TQV81304.1 hypothetical protein FKG94_09425 [Exilibacterium tricleocarpae]
MFSIKRLCRTPDCTDRLPLWCGLWLLLLSGAALAQDASDTLWIEPVAGHKESKLGAQVMKVEKVEGEEEVYKIQLTVPKADTEIEEVVVIAKPNKPKLEAKAARQPRNFEIYNPRDPNRSGIIIYLGKKQDFALRINYEETRSPIEPHLFPEQ